MPSASSSAPTSSPLHPHLVTTTSTSELANALTLPVPVSSYGGYVQRGEEEQAGLQEPAASGTREDQRTTSTPGPPDGFQSLDSVEDLDQQRQGQEQEQEQQGEEEDPTVPTRRCSVKGCKKVIRGVFSFSSSFLSNKYASNNGLYTPPTRFPRLLLISFFFPIFFHFTLLFLAK